MGEQNHNMTMMGGGLFSCGGHLNLKIAEVENGYKVEAVFDTWTKGYDDVLVPSTKNKTFVFYTPAEVVDFVTQYLNAHVQDLQDGAT